MPNWTPDQWDDFSSVGLLAAFVVLFVVALVREWIVIGRYHRDTVNRLDGRAAKDAEAIQTLSDALTEKNATEDATTRILAALRETIKGGEPR